MNLDDYLKSEGAPSAADFAKLAGTTEPTISRIRRGEQNMTVEMIGRVIDASGGKVTADALVEVARRPFSSRSSSQSQERGAQPAEQEWPLR